MTRWYWKLSMHGLTVQVVFTLVLEQMSVYFCPFQSSVVELQKTKLFVSIIDYLEESAPL